MIISFSFCILNFQFHFIWVCMGSPVVPFLPLTLVIRSCSTCRQRCLCLLSVTSGCLPWTGAPPPCSGPESSWLVFPSHCLAHLRVEKNPVKFAYFALFSINEGAVWLVDKQWWGSMIAYLPGRWWEPRVVLVSCPRLCWRWWVGEESQLHQRTPQISPSLEPWGLRFPGMFWEVFGAWVELSVWQV